MSCLTILCIIATLALTNAFSNAFIGQSGRVSHNSNQSTFFSTSSRRSTLDMKVVDIDSEESFDSTITSAGSNLVVVDYSTTWCGPCKVIAPKFDEFSDKYPDAVFLKVIGDATPTASALMKREGVRSVPSFHYFKDGEKIEVVNGANADAIEAAIKNNL